MLELVKMKARDIKKELKVLYLAYRHPAVPWYARVLGAVVLAYALSPIDLIPDFIPILGYLDDVLLIPLGIVLVRKMIPVEALEECRLAAENVFKDGKPKSWIAGFVIIVVWVLIGGVVVFKLVNALIFK